MVLGWWSVCVWLVQGACNRAIDVGDDNDDDDDDDLCGKRRFWRMGRCVVDVCHAHAVLNLGVRKGDFLKRTKNKQIVERQDRFASKELRITARREVN